MTSVQDVIDGVLARVPDAQTTDTVDTVKAGDPTRAVTGIVSTFLATQTVLEQTVELGANLIITHEPTFYNHEDETDWLADDAVFEQKSAYIEQHELAIWRFHDNLHSLRPDPTVAGITEALGWQARAEAGPTVFGIDIHDVIFDIPEMSLSELAALIKDRLDIKALRLVGDPDMTCRTAAVAVGAWPGRFQMAFWRQAAVDVLIAGEIDEWETNEYARDAHLQGGRRGLIVTGHANSEEAGMRWLADWLRPMFPDVPVHHVPAGDPFVFV